MLNSASRAFASSIPCLNLARRIPSVPAQARCYAKYSKASTNYPTEPQHPRSRDPSALWASRRAEGTRPRNRESGPTYPLRKSKPSSLTDTVIPQLSLPELQTIFSEEVWSAPERYLEIFGPLTLPPALRLPLRPDRDPGCFCHDLLPPAP